MWESSLTTRFTYSCINFKKPDEVSIKSRNETLSNWTFFIFILQIPNKSKINFEKIERTSSETRNSFNSSF